MDSEQTDREGLRGPAGRPVRWGILSTGKIARSFGADLRTVPDAVVAAVGSRTLSGAEEYAAEHGGTPYGSYAELVADPDVDVVYVASPHGLHHEHVRLALEAGKPVLCEKALTLNAAQAEELVALAGERGLFLMEAMWMACHPLVRDVRRRVAAGELGTPQQLVADLGWVVDKPPTDRMFAPELGGGALLDMGVYVLTLAQLLLGEPATQTILADQAEGSGVDLNVAIAARYENGAVAALTTSMTSHSPRTATLATDTGRLDFPAPFHHPSRVMWTPYVDGRPQPATLLEPPEPVLGTGLGNEAAEVGRCLREGLLESPMVPHAQTLAVLRQMDTLRAQIGLTYPGER